MSKKNTLTLTQEQLQELIAGAVAQAMASMPTKSATVGRGKAKAEPKLVEFTKADGTVVKCTEAQAKAWDAYRNRAHKSLDEVKALKPEISAKGRAYVKAHPSCTRKEAAANGCKNITKEGLKALKVELGVR